MYNSSVEVENLNEQFKIQTMNFGGDRTPYISPVDASKLNTKKYMPLFLKLSSY